MSKLDELELKVEMSERTAAFLSKQLLECVAELNETSIDDEKKLAELEERIVGIQIKAKYEIQVGMALVKELLAIYGKNEPPNI